MKGEASHVELQAHLAHMGEDRFKKAARSILNFALNVEGAMDRDGAVSPRVEEPAADRASIVAWSKTVARERDPPGAARGVRWCAETVS